MRKFAILAVLAVLALAVSTSVSARPGPVGAMYEWNPSMGPVGMLHFANGHGQQFRAFNAHGHPVMDGFVDAPYIVVPCPCDGLDKECGTVLRVELEQGAVFNFSVDDPSDWMWD